jgi:Na+/H+-dicarboxylate symporter
MLLIFAATGVVAALLMLAAVGFYPPAQGVVLPVTQVAPARPGGVGEQIVGTLTVPDFVQLLSKQNMLPLIIFAVLVGLATSATGEKGRAFAALLTSGNEVFMKIISYIMLYAPVGLAAYFAYLVGVFGPGLLGSYLRAMILYYPVCILYFFIAFTAYAYLAGRARGVRAFWTNIPAAALTATATGSSFAAIPLNLEAANRVGVPKDISEVVIPIGATIHMDGSVLAALLKIAFLFGLYNMPFSGFETLALAVGISLLSGVVMSGIPGGGFTGEILIVTLYGFPPEALAIISMIGQLVDPPATAINSVGDNVASMMVARILHGPKWMDRPAPAQERA